MARIARHSPSPSVTLPIAVDNIPRVLQQLTQEEQAVMESRKEHQIHVAALLDSLHEWQVHTNAPPSSPPKLTTNIGVRGAFVAYLLMYGWMDGWMDAGLDAEGGESSGNRRVARNTVAAEATAATARRGVSL